MSDEVKFSEFVYFLQTGCFHHQVWELAFFWLVMNVRLLNAVILVHNTWGQEGNCGLLDAAKGVEKFIF